MKTLSIIALALTLLIGCATHKVVKQPVPEVVAPRPVLTGQVVSYHTIDAELKPLMSEDYEPQLIVMDTVYGCVPEDETRRIIAEALATFSTRYIEEARDCDDLAIEIVVKMRTIFRRETDNVPLASTFGIIGGALVGDIPELNYHNGGIAYHAMAVVRCKGGKWLLIEPFSKQVCEFTGTIYEGSFEFILGIF